MTRLTETRSRLDRIDQLLGTANGMLAEVIELLIGTDLRSVIAEEGQTVRSWLRVVAGCTGADERTLMLAAQRLVHLPKVRQWLADGTFTWPVVRSIVFTTRRLTVAQLAWLDETLTADARRLRRLDADGVIDVVERLAADVRPDLAADRTQRQFDRRYAQVQTGVDGSVQLYAEFDAEMGAAVIQALETTPVGDPPDDAPGHAPGGAEDHRHTGARQPAEPQPGRSAGQRRADALYALCLQRAAASGGHGVEGVHGIRPAAPAEGHGAVLVQRHAPATLVHRPVVRWTQQRQVLEDRWATVNAVDHVVVLAPLRGLAAAGEAAVDVAGDQCRAQRRADVDDRGAHTERYGAVHQHRPDLTVARLPTDCCVGQMCGSAAGAPQQFGGAVDPAAPVVGAGQRGDVGHDEDARSGLRRRERRLTTVPFHDRRRVPTAPPPRRRRPPPRGAPPLVPATPAHDGALPF
jgi:hypothetical protein